MQSTTTTSSISIRSCSSLLQAEYTELFLPNSNTQVLSVSPLNHRRPRASRHYLAHVFDFDTLRADTILLPADAPLDVVQ